MPKEEKNSIALVSQDLLDNKNLVQMYQESAQLGSKNLAGELPLLKIHTSEKSQNNILADGSEPQNGNFFYKPTQQEFEEITCHILTISRGYKADGLNDRKNVFHQIMAGVIVDEGTPKPFMMYVTGLKLQPLWDFGKEAHKYTTAKPVPIPMFALTVKLTTKKVEHKFGKSWIINFELLKDKDGKPLVITDEGLFVYLRDRIENMEKTIEQLIASKGSELNEEAELAGVIQEDPVKDFPEKDLKKDEDDDEDDSIYSKDIPF